MSRFQALDQACESLSGITAAVLAVKSMLPSLSAEDARVFREGVRRPASTPSRRAGESARCDMVLAKDAKPLRPSK